MDATERVVVVDRVLRMLGQYYTADAYCLTLVPGAASALVLQGFGVDYTAEPAGDEPSVGVIEGAGFVLAVEPNGGKALDPRSCGELLLVAEQRACSAT